MSAVGRTAGRATASTTCSTTDIVLSNFTDDEKIGIGVFITSTEGIGGKLRARPEDFIVEEEPILPPYVKNGRYTIVKVQSENWETNKLVRKLAKNLKISRKRISFAGTKDKRAITTQWISVDSPIEIVKEAKLPKNVKFLDLYTADKGIRLGDLIGNKFKIKITNLNMDSEKLKKNVSEIYEKISSIGGFPNFFGVQRFGAVRPITHEIGKCIVKDDFEHAVRLYLGKTFENEEKDAYEARKFFESTNCYREALKRFPKKLTFERAILNYLIKKPTDYVGALKQLPKNLLMMFVHAYQAYLYNKILTERIISKIPLNEAQVGDILIPVDKYNLPNPSVQILATEQNIGKLNAKLKEGKLFITALLVGYSAKFAGGIQGEIERRIIDAENLLEKDFIIPKLHEISSKGMRKEILSPVKNFSVTFGDKCITFEFSLNKGSYATALLREFMKTNFMNY